MQLGLTGSTHHSNSSTSSNRTFTSSARSIGIKFDLGQVDLDQQLHQSTVLGMIATSRFNLYNTKILLRPDLVPLLPPRKPIYAEIPATMSWNYSGRYQVSRRSRLLTQPNQSRALCSNFFVSKAIGDLTNWPMLSLVVLQSWETKSTEWKDLLVAEVLKVDWVDDQRVDGMACVTQLLAGEFVLSEFMVGAPTKG